MGNVGKTKNKSSKKQEPKESKYLEALVNNTGTNDRVFTKKAKQVISQLMVQDMAMGVGLEEI